MAQLKEGSTLEYMNSLVGKEFSDSPSPFGRWLKGRIVSVERGSFSLAFRVREEFTNPAGLLHGGVIAAIADEAIGVTIIGSDLARLFVSINLSVQYIAPAKVGDEIIARTRLVDARKKMVTFDWEIVSSEGSLIARGTSQVSKSTG